MALYDIEFYRGSANLNSVPGRGARCLSIEGSCPVREPLESGCQLCQYAVDVARLGGIQQDNGFQYEKAF